ncbi:MAG: site-specific integrase [Nitrososphaerales archaeon]
MKKPGASRCWRGAQPRYRGLFEDPNVKRWYDNVSRGSRITADVYLRRLGSICKSRGIRSPEELLTRATGDGGTLWAYNFTMDLVTKLEAEGKAGSYIHSVTKALRSWFAHNGINVEGRVKIRGAQDTPSLRDKHAPTSSELAMFFSNAPPQTRCAGALVAQAGLRLEVVGNYDGSDGLRIGDLPEITIGPDASDDGAGGQIGFSRTPAMVVVRPELSKAGHQYFTFLAKEGCEYITQYLTLRTRSGEKLDASSPLICPGSTKPRKNLFVRSGLVSALIRKRLRSCAIKARPYDLRSSFDTSLMLAESRGLIIRDYRVFFMGHKGDIEHRYTLNRHSLPSDVIGDMRTSFEKAQRYLMTPQFSTEDDVATQVKRQMLLTVGYKQGELEKIALTEAGDEEIQDLVKQKLFAVMMNNGQRQRVVPPEEVEKAIAEGWEWIGNLPNGKAVLRLPV